MTDQVKIIVASITGVILLFIALFTFVAVIQFHYQTCILDMNRPHYSAADMRHMCRGR